MIVKINTISGVEESFKILEKEDILALDTETSGLNPRTHKLLTVQIGTKSGEIFVYHGSNEIFKHLFSRIKDKKFIIHNSKFDLSFIFENTGILLTNVFCTMLAERLLTSGLGVGDYFKSLQNVVKKYAGVDLDKSLRKTFYESEFSELTEDQISYASADVMYLFSVYEEQIKNIQSLNLTRVCELENKFTPVLVVTEHYGVKIDKPMWLSLAEKAKEEMNKEMAEILNEVISDIVTKLNYYNALDVCQALQISSAMAKKKDIPILMQVTSEEMLRDLLYAHVNLNSNVQVKNILNKVYNINVPDTNEKTLNKYLDKFPIIDKILKYRELSKSVTSFGEKFLRYVEQDGRIHTEYNQLGAVTGRLSSSNPNLQNIKRDSSYRNAFIPDDGYVFICADYSQEELRIMADVSNEKAMIDAFNSGVDLHALTASKLFGVDLDKVTKEQRSVGKSLNFGVIYGISPEGLYRNFSIKKEDGEKYLNEFFNTHYPVLGKFYKALGNLVLKQGFSSTLFGRKRFFNQETDGINSIIRRGVNMLIQGTGADVIKEAMCKIFYNNPFSHDDLHIVLQVHDEIVVEVRKEIAEEAKAFVSECMLSAEASALKHVKPEIDIKIADRWVH